MEGERANLSCLWSRRSVQKVDGASQDNHHFSKELLTAQLAQFPQISIRQFCSQSKTFCMALGSAAYQGYSLSAPVSFMTGDGSSFINWYKNKTAHVTRPGSLHARASLQRLFSPLSLLIQSVQTFPVPQIFLIAVLGCSERSSCTITCTWKMMRF